MDNITSLRKPQYRSLSHQIRHEARIRTFRKLFKSYGIPALQALALAPFLYAFIFLYLLVM